NRLLPRFLRQHLSHEGGDVEMRRKTGRPCRARIVRKPHGVAERRPAVRARRPRRAFLEAPPALRTQEAIGGHCPSTECCRSAGRAKSCPRDKSCQAAAGCMPPRRRVCCVSDAAHRAQESVMKKSIMRATLPTPPGQTLQKQLDLLKKSGFDGIQLGVQG